MSGDLKELQEVFPHGSRWHVPVDLVRTLADTNTGRSWAEYEVVGWHRASVIALDTSRNTAVLPPAAQVEAKRLDVPCPITQTVSLTHRRGDATGGYWIQHDTQRTDGRLADDDGLITLHPPGAKPLTENYGIYTWQAL